MKTAIEIALEKARRIWEKTTPEEIKNLNMKENAQKLVGKYLNNNISLEELIKEVKDAEDKENFIKLVQKTFLEMLRIRSDIEKISSAMIELEKLKEKNNYRKMKYLFEQEIIPLKRQYEMILEEARDQVKEILKQKVHAAVQKIREQFKDKEVLVIADDENIPVESSEEWIDFVSENDAKFNQVLTEYTKRLEELI